MIEQLLKPEVQKFIQEHKAGDPALLMLQYKKYAHLPLREIAQQVKAIQKLKFKLPEWVAKENIIFPSTLSLEQSSSQKSAEYKSNLLSGDFLVDLTGGMGVDTYYFSKKFKHVAYVESNPDLFQVTQHNLKVLGASNVSCHFDTAENFLLSDFKADCIYIDPDRRGKQHKKLVLLSDCEPNIIQLLPEIFEKANMAIIKTSPILDISEAVRELKNVAEAHIIAVDNEVKEVLYILKKGFDAPPQIVTKNLINDEEPQSFSFTMDKEALQENTYSLPLKYLYEPNAAVLKAGAFKSVGAHFNLKKLHVHTHLYTSEGLVKNFPGRIFRVNHQLAFNKKQVLQLLPGKKANITTRNFPNTVDEIRKKTGIKEGGTIYLFAATGLQEKHLILFCDKID